MSLQKTYLLDYPYFRLRNGILLHWFTCRSIAAVNQLNCSINCHAQYSRHWISEPLHSLITSFKLGFCGPVLLIGRLMLRLLPIAATSCDSPRFLIHHWSRSFLRLPDTWQLGNLHISLWVGSGETDMLTSNRATEVEGIKRSKVYTAWNLKC